MLDLVLGSELDGASDLALDWMLDWVLDRVLFLCKMFWLALDPAGSQTASVLGLALDWPFERDRASSFVLQCWVLDWASGW